MKTKIDLEAKKKVEIRRKLRLAGLKSKYINGLNQKQLKELYNIFIKSKKNNNKGIL